MDNDALREALELVNQQAEDDGLWFGAQTAPEAYLQQSLRDLHRKVEALFSSKPEPQAQAGEPTTVAFHHFHKGDRMYYAQGQLSFTKFRPDQEPLIRLKDYREAMAEQHEIEAQLSGQLAATSRACIEKDAALKACVEALEHFKYRGMLFDYDEKEIEQYYSTIQQAFKALK